MFKQHLANAASQPPVCFAECPYSTCCGFRLRRRCSVQSRVQLLTHECTCAKGRGQKLRLTLRCACHSPVSRQLILQQFQRLSSGALCHCGPVRQPVGQRHLGGSSMPLPLFCIFSLSWFPRPPLSWVSTSLPSSSLWDLPALQICLVHAKLSICPAFWRILSLLLPASLLRTPLHS